MKKGLIISLFLSVVILSGCSTLFSRNQGVVGKASVAEDKAKARIELIDTSASTVNVERLDKIGAFAEGISYSLSKEPSPSVAVITATKLNDRIIALANKPDFNEAKEIATLVDDLITDQVKGEKELQKKDVEIEKLMASVKDLQEQKTEALNNYFSLANRTAATADQYQATLGQMDSWGGLGAIWYGIKRLITRLAWVLGIGGILFLVLRLASMSNPIAASIFSVFNVIGSWFVHAIRVIFPKALQVAGNVSKQVYDEAAQLLNKIVDSVEWIKEIEKQTGQPITLKALFVQLDKTMDQKEKAMIDDIKKKLGY